VSIEFVVKSVKALIESGVKSPHACRATSNAGCLFFSSVSSWSTGGHSSKTFVTPASSNELTRWVRLPIVGFRSDLARILSSFSAPVFCDGAQSTARTCRLRGGEARARER
jgi:hypothetical protein